MRIRLNTKADELWIELEGEKGTLGDGEAFPEPIKTIEIPGEHGRAAIIAIDADGYVRLVRVARLNDIIEEFSPSAAKAARKKPLTPDDIARRTRGNAGGKP
jgi:hypothetical protein